MKKLIFIILLPLVLAACGEQVEVPPAHVGKILGANGFQPDNVPPSKFRLDACWSYCDKLVLLEVSDVGAKEAFKLFMPKDQLNMAFDVRFTLSVDDSAASIDSIFSRVTTQEGKISVEKIYNTYGKPVIRERVRSVVAKYSIQEMVSSREAINAEVYAEVVNSLKGTPIKVKRLAFGDMQFPAVITQAKEDAAERRELIKQAEAQKQIELVKLQTELEKAKANRAIRREKAETVAEENAITAASVTESYLKYKTLEVLELMASNENAVFVPMSSLDELGLQQRLFAK